MKNLNSLSIFFPVYNDAQIIPELIKKADKTAKIITSDYEIICINDGSTDNSSAVLNQLQKTYSNLKIVNHKKNKGYGGALISGFDNSKKEWVFYTDGDGQYDPNELLLLVDVVDDSIDVVNGFKIKRSDSFVRRLIGRFNNFVLHLFFPIPISDIDCDFRLIRNSLLKSFELKSQSGTICTELVLKLQKQGARFAEVGVNHFKRPYGTSQFFNVSKITQTIVDNVKLFLSYKMNKL